MDNNNKTTKDTTLHIRIGGDLKRDLQTCIDAQCVNLSALVRKLLLEWLDKQKTTTRQPKDNQTDCN